MSIVYYFFKFKFNTFVFDCLFTVRDFQFFFNFWKINSKKALERGHIKTALFLVEQSNMMKNSPCSFTDLQLTTLTSTADRAYPVNMPVKARDMYIGFII